MSITVKYALDAESNVGIFSAELKPGDMTIVFKKVIDGQQYQVSLINENGFLYVRIVDPSREARGEPAKVRKAAQVNEVFSIGTATVMIMAIQGEEITGVRKGAPSNANREPSGMEISGISDEITDIPNPGGAKMSPIAAPPPIVPVPRPMKTPPPPPIKIPQMEMSPPPTMPRPESQQQNLNMPDPDFQNSAMALEEANRNAAAAAEANRSAAALKMELPPPAPPVSVGPKLVRDNDVSEIEMPEDTSSESFRPVTLSEQITKNKAPVNLKIKIATPPPPVPTFEEPVAQIGPEDSQIYTVPKIDTNVPMPSMGENTAAALNIDPSTLTKAPDSAFEPDPEEEPEMIKKPARPSAPPPPVKKPTPVHEKEDSFSKKISALHKNIDPSALPSVDGAKLNFNPDFEHGSNPLPEAKAREKAAETKKVERLEVPKPRSRAQLLTDDVRDRRVYVKGAKYSIRNKMAALLMFLGIAVISAYSFGISTIADRTKEWLISDSVKAQVLLRSQEYLTRLKNHHFLVSSILQLVEREKLDQQSMAKALGGAEPLLSVGVFRYLPSADVEEANTPPPLPPPPPAPTGKSKTLPIKRAPEPEFVPKYDTSKLIKLSDGNFLEPVANWVRQVEANALDLDPKKVTADHSKLIIESFSKVPPGMFDPKNYSLPVPMNGIYNYVVRTNLSSPFFVVIQTTQRYFSEIFNPQSDMDYYLFQNRKTLLLPERKKNDPVVGDILTQLSNSQMEPIRENGYTTSVPISSDTDLVGRPNQYKMEMFATDTKTTAAFAAVILLAFLGAGIWFSKRITEPLFTLVKQIESVTAGDYHTKFDVGANDEIGLVCDYFEHLSATLRKKENELARVTDLAKKDPLTGLYNHSYFRSQLEAKWKEIENKGGSLILIDIDDFRKFNQAQGHIQGDLVLKDLALGIQEVVKFGITARYGGEEFVVWAPGLDQKNAFELAETIQKRIRALKTPSLTGGSPFTVNCSIGVTNFTKGKHNNIDQFLRDADYNMAMAKKAGKNRIWAGAA